MVCHFHFKHPIPVVRKNISRDIIRCYYSVFIYKEIVIQTGLADKHRKLACFFLVSSAVEDTVLIMGRK